MATHKIALLDGDGSMLRKCSRHRVGEVWTTSEADSEECLPTHWTLQSMFPLVPAGTAWLGLGHDMVPAVHQAWLRTEA